MKAFFPEAVLAAALLSSVLCVGCQGQRANADEIPAVANPAPVAIEATADAKPVAETSTPAAIPPVAPPGSIIITKASAQTADSPVVNSPNANTSAANAETNALPEIVPPSQLQLSPALADVIKLVQAGVGEDVLLTYITNSTDIFNIGSSEILYLHDLGVSANIITTLIHQDSTPEALGRKQAANSVKPLPPGVSLTTPATNIYPPTIAQQPPVNPVVQTEPVTSEVPAAPDDAAPAVVYTVPPVQETVDVNQFYTELAPYGSWIDVAGYGRCWRPTVAVWNSAWRPYADGGRWVWTDRGWYWYSDYSWGWAPFHYGRWTTHHGVGWVWVPDVHWGPAWVSWRSARSHCGWAPLPPSARWVSGHGFYHNTLSVGVSFDFGLSDYHYVYLPTSRFCDRRPSTYYVAPHHARSLHRESTVVNNYVSGNNNTVVNNGIGYDRIAGATRGTIRQASVRPTIDTPRGTLRREMLDREGRTLTVAPPPASAGTASIKPPARPVSALSSSRAQTGRAVSSSSAFAAPSDSRTPASVPQGDSSRSPQPIIMRGTGRAGGEPRTATLNPATSGSTTVATPGTASGRSAIPEAPAVRTPAAPRGGRPSTRTAEPPATSVAVTRPATVPAPAVREATPAATVRIPAPAARPQPSRNSVQPVAPRSPVMTVPSAAPRQAPSAPSYNPAPRPAPAPAPRVEAPRVSSPAPAPQPAPSRSSDGGSRSTQSSGDGSGRRISR